MDTRKIHQILRNGEGLTVEFKECSSKLSDSVFETVSSFSNRYGGHLILGVKDDGEIVGVNPAAAQGMKKNFINMLNNRRKFRRRSSLNWRRSLSTES